MKKETMKTVVKVSVLCGGIACAAALVLPYNDYVLNMVNGAISKIYDKIDEMK